MWRKENQ